MKVVPCILKGQTWLDSLFCDSAYTFTPGKLKLLSFITQNQNCFQPYKFKNVIESKINIKTTKVLVI